MGACCSCQLGGDFQGNVVEEDEEEREAEHDEDEIVLRGYGGARVRLQGSSNSISMFSQQGKKGFNQDAMTVWENFLGEKDMLFCAVLDGHGPSGHKVVRYVRDLLPVKISWLDKESRVGGKNVKKNMNNAKEGNDNHFLSSWRDKLVDSFHEMDDELEGDSTIESYCSGTTSVAMVKKGEHLVIANLGDSRAVLCTRDNKDDLVAEQLTVDLKPNVPSEAQRIESCQGRILAMAEEPNVFRVWMPDADCPGLAMARAFGDFCLKDFGLISQPEVTYRKLTERDDFVVLATDGIWDVLSNDEVIRIVACAKKRSMAAKLLVERAVRTWRHKYPRAKIDDCAVICIFFKRKRATLTKSISELTELSMNQTELGVQSQPISTKTDDELDTILNCNIEKSPETAPDASDGSNPALDRPRKRRLGKIMEDHM